MCSRYYIDPDMMEEISRVVQNIDGRFCTTLEISSIISGSI